MGFWIGLLIFLGLSKNIEIVLIVKVFFVQLETRVTCTAICTTINSTILLLTFCNGSLLSFCDDKHIGYGVVYQWHHQIWSLVYIKHILNICLWCHNNRIQCLDICFKKLKISVRLFWTISILLVRGKQKHCKSLMSSP